MSRFLAQPIDPAAIPSPAQARFWGFVDRSEGCWLWTGGRANGYGLFHLPTENGERRGTGAHRVAYALANGIVLTHENAETLDHLCRNRACVNPEHLEPVTLRENIRRAISSSARANARKTHCSRGHEFTPENTLTRPGRNVRECRTCAVEYRRLRTERARRNRVLAAVSARSVRPEAAA